MIASLTFDSNNQGVQHRMVLVVNVFHIFEIISLCFVVAVFDLLPDVDAIHDLYLLLLTSGKLFCNTSNARETANCSFTGITCISKKTSRCC